VLGSVAVVEVQSTMRIRFIPCFFMAWQAPMATLLKMQNPAARPASAWCPGGRTKAKALPAVPSTTRSTAFMNPPAARSAVS
jgi:hypothetical protein